jgi:hypothetical protein
MGKGWKDFWPQLIGRDEHGPRSISFLWRLSASERGCPASQRVGSDVNKRKVLTAKVNGLFFPFLPH